VSRNFVSDLEDKGRSFRFLVSDRDSKFTAAFDAVFDWRATRVIKRLVRALRANAFAQRWVGTVRRECTDQPVALGRRHIDVVLRRYVVQYNTERPHRRLQLRLPAPRLRRRSTGRAWSGATMYLAGCSIADTTF
jgi:transposase InsO family protein